MRNGGRIWLGLGLALSLSLSAWAAPNWKTLTDAPRDTNGSEVNYHRPIRITQSNGSVVIALPNDQWAMNRSGAMGADKEFFNEEKHARLGIWAGQSLEGKSPRATISEWSAAIKGITGGQWSTPKSTYIAGVPVIQATGVDVFGNYYYRLIAFTKFGINYGLALRTPYENRYNRALDEDLTSIITESHISTAAAKRLHR